MAGRGIGAVLALLLAAALPAQTHSAQALPTQTGDVPMLLGAQTHFSQGWGLPVLDLARTAQAPLLRDALPWRMGEPQAGHYDFTGQAARRLDAACRAGHRLILTEVPVHPQYDQGLWVSTGAGRQAFAAYAAALSAHFGACLVAIELGNEINAPDAMAFAPGLAPAAGYVAIAGAVHARLQGFPALLGGSTNMIGTGFLRGLFAAELLPVVDGLAVHPYRRHAEGLGEELARLDAAMDAFGRRVPVWATEFGLDTRDDARAADELLRQATVLAAGGVRAASWYALIDQAGFPAMGLFAGDAIKPQGRAFRFIQQRLLASARPHRIDLGDPHVFAWRFGDGITVLWGAPRRLTPGPGAQVYSAQGDAVTDPSIGDAPLVVVGGAFTLGPPSVVADTLLDAGGDSWQLFVRDGGGRDTPLAWIDETWTSHRGTRFTRPLRIEPDTAAVAGDGAHPLRAVWRFTVKEAGHAAGRFTANGCFTKALRGDGVDLALWRNGVPVWQAVLTDQILIGPLPLDLAAGDRIELVAGPNRTAGGDGFAYRLVLARGAGALRFGSDCVVSATPAPLAVRAPPPAPRWAPAARSAP